MTEEQGELLLQARDSLESAIAHHIISVKIKVYANDCINLYSCYMVLETKWCPK